MRFADCCIAAACRVAAPYRVVAWVALAAGCVLKKPPDTAAFKAEALPDHRTCLPRGPQRPAAVARRQTTGWHLSTTRSCRRQSPRRSRTTPTCGSAPLVSTRRCSTPGSPAPGSIRRSTCWRAAAARCQVTTRGLQGAALTVGLGGRSLGPRALRPRGGAGRCGINAGRFRIRAAVDCRAGRARAGSSPPKRGCRPSSRARTILDTEALVRLAEDRARVGVGNEEEVYVARAIGRDLS